MSIEIDFLVFTSFEKKTSMKSHHMKRKQPSQPIQCPFINSSIFFRCCPILFLFLLREMWIIF